MFRLRSTAPKPATSSCCKRERPSPDHSPYRKREDTGGSSSAPAPTDSTLPPPGTRVTPSHAAAMPKIVAGASSGHAQVGGLGGAPFRVIRTEGMAAGRGTTLYLVPL